MLLMIEKMVNQKIKINGDNIISLINRRLCIDDRYKLYKLLNERHNLVTAKADINFEKGYKSAIMDIILLFGVD